MANANGWGDGASNNNIGWGKGADNAIGWGDIHADSYAGLTDIVGTPAFTGLLDTYSGAAVAYSLRQLSSTYTGSAIRVRRSSDNAEQDISFVENDLDTASMLDFVGYNRWTYSEQFNNALYVKTNINTTGTPAYVDVETAPDSTLTGDKIIENATSGSHLFRRETGTIINGNSYNISVYLKQGERTSVEIASQISGTLQTCILDLTNGNTSSNGFANTPVVTLETNGWYRFSVTITSGVTSQLTGLRVSLRNASNATSYLGDGTSGAYVWGTQLSQTSTVKTYQKTVATAGGNGFVTTWYDQSGNSRNSTQTTAAYQPQIVSSGSLLLLNTKGSIEFNGITGKALSFANFPGATSYSITSVLSSIEQSQYTKLLSIGPDATTSGVWYTINTGGTVLEWQSNDTGFGGNGYNNLSGPFVVSNGRIIPDSMTTQNLVTTVLSSSNAKMFRNGSEISYRVQRTGNCYNTVGTMIIGNAPNNQNTMNGRLQELVIWQTDQNSNIAGINTNINTYWNAY
jgi:hypothetical protein